MEKSRLYSIQSIPSKGLGWITTRKITRGTRILSESPLFKIPRDVSSMSSAETIVLEQLKNLSKEQQRAFLQLDNCHRSECSPFLGIARTNSLPLGSNASDGGLFLESSRINHSCLHNAQNTWNDNLGELTIHAIIDIEIGTEIAISYIDGTRRFEERQQHLRKNFGFTCACRLCSMPLNDRHENDIKAAEIYRLDEYIGDGMNIIGSPLSCLYAAYDLRKLLEGESCQDARVPRAYYDAFQIVIAHGDQARASVFADMAYKARRVIEGDDSPTTIRMKALASNPAQHRLYGTSMRWRTKRDAVPRDMNDDSLERWLWRCSGRH